MAHAIRIVHTFIFSRLWLIHASRMSSSFVFAFTKWCGALLAAAFCVCSKRRLYLANAEAIRQISHISLVKDLFSNYLHPKITFLEDRKVKNEIVAEIRRYCAAILESFGGDIGKMMRSMMASQGSHRRKVVAFKKREPQFVPNAYPLREARLPMEQTAAARCW